MKIRRFLDLFLFSILLFSPGPLRAYRPQVKTHEAIVKEGDVYQGVHFPAGTKLVLVDENNAVSYAFLSRDFVMNGHSLKKGTQLQIWDDGTLMAIWTQPNQRIGGIQFPDAGVEVNFSNRGRLKEIYLRTPMDVQGYKFIGIVEFHLTGKVAKGTLSEDQAKEGLHIRRGIEISFHPSGAIERVALSGESKVGSLVLTGTPDKLGPGETWFLPNGKLRQGVLAKAAVIQGFDCGLGPISFYESGALRELTLGKERVVLLNPYKGQRPVEKSCKAGDRLTFAESGEVIGWAGK